MQCHRVTVRASSTWDRATNFSLTIISQLLSIKAVAAEEAIKARTMIRTTILRGAKVAITIAVGEVFHIRRIVIMRRERCRAQIQILRADSQMEVQITHRVIKSIRGRSSITLS